jgi:cell division protein FtsB
MAVQSNAARVLHTFPSGYTPGRQVEATAPNRIASRQAKQQQSANRFAVLMPLAIAVICAAPLYFRVAGHAKVTQENYTKVQLQRELTWEMEETHRLRQQVVNMTSSAAVAAYVVDHKLVRPTMSPIAVGKMRVAEARP